MEKSKSSGVKALFPVIVIPATIVVSILIYMFILGSPGNFMGDNPANSPKEGNYLGVVYKGGVIVPLLMSFLLMVITFSVERFITLMAASGKGQVEGFVKKVRSLLSEGNVSSALSECDLQQGSLGNVIKAMLVKYTILQADKQLTKDQKLAALQKELEESTALELPMLEKNLTIIATLASISTLTGLLGTVIGMIKAFAALATAGAPDAIELANGISEALINTALGIATSALAIIACNYFTNRIDNLTYGIDEIGYSVTQSFSSTNAQ